MDRQTAGLVNGTLGVIVFSGSLVATRAAVADLDPVFLTAARAAIAAVCGGALLIVSRQALPRRDELAGLAVVALGVVVGFPLLTGWALLEMSATRATVFVGLLPLVTAIAGALRAGERPQPVFWLFAVTGSLIVGGYAMAGPLIGGTAGAGGLAPEALAADAAMLGAIVACGIGYAEGARLTRRLGGWQVISWALVVALPVMAPLALATLPDFGAVGAPALAGLGYVSLFSMLIGFIFWYRGLALGGIAAVSQLQLLQPFLGLLAAAAILGEPIDAGLFVVVALVIGCVFAARRFATAPAR